MVTYPRINDHGIFPEVSSDGTNATIGMDVSINTTASNDDEGRELLSSLVCLSENEAEVEAEEAASQRTIIYNI